MAIIATNNCLRPRSSTRWVSVEIKKNQKNLILSHSPTHPVRRRGEQRQSLYARDSLGSRISKCIANHINGYISESKYVSNLAIILLCNLSHHYASLTDLKSSNPKSPKLWRLKARTGLAVAWPTRCSNASKSICSTTWKSFGSRKSSPKWPKLSRRYSWRLKQPIQPNRQRRNNSQSHRSGECGIKLTVRGIDRAAITGWILYDIYRRLEQANQPLLPTHRRRWRFNKVRTGSRAAANLRINQIEFNHISSSGEQLGESGKPWHTIKCKNQFVYELIEPGERASQRERETMWCV